jgi:hypothetical protein
MGYQPGCEACVERLKTGEPEPENCDQCYRRIKAGLHPRVDCDGCRSEAFNAQIVEYYRKQGVALEPRGELMACFNHQQAEAGPYWECASCCEESRYPFPASDYDKALAATVTEDKPGIEVGRSKPSRVIAD